MRAACGQLVATPIDHAEEAWPAVDRLVDQARRARADLLVLPEITYPAYWLESLDRYFAPDILRSDAVLDRFSRAAAAAGLWLVVGFVEERAGRLFNSAAVLDSSGNVVAVARKNFLWDCDNRWFAPGDELLTAATPWGRMGVQICADARAPEITATLARGGAALIAHPTAWVNSRRGSGEFRNVQADFLIRARAAEFGIPFLSADKAGREAGLEYVGQSMIVDAAGRVLSAAPIEGEHLVVADVLPGAPTPRELSAEHRTRLLAGPAPAVATQRPVVFRLAPADAKNVAEQLSAAGARWNALSVEALAHYEVARCAALDGAQVLLATGRVDDDLFARARACENRVYVVVADRETQRIVHPAGHLVCSGDDARPHVEIDLRAADSKKFTPETDLWPQRRTSCYQL